jgi:hypothetical protein
VALYFKQKVGNFTTACNILADSAPLRVVETALGFSSIISEENIDTLAKLLTTAMSNAGVSTSSLQNATVPTNF